MCIQNKLGHYAIHTVAFAGAKEAMELVLEIGKLIWYCYSTNSPLQIFSQPIHHAV